MPSIPAGGPTWLGWAFFVVLAVLLVIREVSNARSASASREREKIEVQKIKLDLLRESAEHYAHQLEAITAALSADAAPPPSEAQLAALEAGPSGTGSGHMPSVARHLRARKMARDQLPELVAQVVAVRNRETALERDLALGVTVGDDSLSQLGQKVDALATDLGRVVILLAESPRIAVSATPPEARDGDLWVQLPDLSDDEA